MKNILLCLFAIVAWNVLVADDDTLMAKARDLVEHGRSVYAGETEETGAYCLVAVRMSSSVAMSESDREGNAVLEAKRKLAAYIFGENMSASRKLEQSSSTSSSGNRVLKHDYTKRIETKSEAFLRSLKPIGRVTDGNKEFLVYLSTERAQDESEALAMAQATNGSSNVVRSCGEGATLEEAIKNAKRLAVEQVLGSVVVGNEKSETGKGFSSKSQSATDGRVEEFRIETQSQVAGGVRVEIVAKVSKENPFDKIVFYVEAPHHSATKRISEIVSESSIRVSGNPSEAGFIVRCGLDFEDFPHPATGRMCTRAMASVRIQNMKTGEEFLNLVADKPVVSKLGTETRRREDCSSRAISAIEASLRQKFQDAVARISRRVLDNK